jgi:hypothetical protein
MGVTIEQTLGAMPYLFDGIESVFLRKKRLCAIDGALAVALLLF